MSPQTKRWIRQVAVGCKLTVRRCFLRNARYLFDAIEERLHNAEVQLRADLEQLGQNSRPQFGPSAGAAVVHRASVPHAAAPTETKFEKRNSKGETFTEWEARRAGFAPAAKSQRRRLRPSAASFDLRFSSAR